MFFFGFQILAFLAVNEVTKFPPNFVFRIIEYLMMVSERNHHKDVKKGNFFLKFVSVHKRNSVLKVQFSAILLLKIVQDGRKFKSKANSLIE